MGSEDRIRVPRHVSGKAAEYYVAAELTKRGYTVAMPPGNVAGTDLFVESPRGDIFGVEVKSLRRPNFWLIKDTSVEFRRYYVLVLMTEPFPRYFIFSPQEMAEEKAAHWHACLDRGRTERDTLQQGIKMGQVYPYENKWNSLPS